MVDDDERMRPPARLRRLASWQTNKVSILGARLTGQRMPLSARADFAVLAALEEYGPLSQADLGRRLGLDRNDVNGILGRLEAERHVHRAPNPADRRRNIVTVTDAGREYLDELQKHADAVHDELLQGLDQGERERLQQLLDKLLGSHQPQSA